MEGCNSLCQQIPFSDTNSQLNDRNLPFQWITQFPESKQRLLKKVTL